MLESTLREAQDYLNCSHELKEALGISLKASCVVTALGQGEHNANFTFTHPETMQRLVLRVNYASQLNLDNQISYEYQALKELVPSGRTPRPLFVDDSCSYINRGVLVMEFCPGRHMCFEEPGDLQEVAQVLADIHNVAPAANTALISPGDALLDLYEECVRMFAVYQSSAFVDSRLVNTIEQYFAAVEPYLKTQPNRAECRHILNTEAVPSHFIIPQSGVGAYMVDWEKPILGEVARDVAYFLAPTTTIWDTEFMFDRAGQEAFVELYWNAVNERFPRGCFDERFEAFMLMNCLRGITWSAMTQAEYHDPNRSLKNDKTRDKLKVYLSDDYLSMLARDYFRC